MGLGVYRRVIGEPRTYNVEIMTCTSTAKSANDPPSRALRVKDSSYGEVARTGVYSEK